MTKKYGPLAALIGIWEGDKGEDLAPGKDRALNKNTYRERFELVPMDDVHNHEQQLASLRYKTTIWSTAPGAGPNPFHEEVGYWLWDAKREEVLRCFLIPRGISIIAGAIVKPDAKSFTLESNSGDCTHGICANKFLDEEFKTVKYTCKIQITDEGFSYEQNSLLKIKGMDKHFDHIDKNFLKKIQ